MQSFFARCLVGARNGYSRIFSSGKAMHSLTPELRGQEASDLIAEVVSADSPCMISRFGSGELAAVLASYFKQNYSFLNNVVAYIRGRRSKFWLDDRIIKAMTNNAGFFPWSESLVERYAEVVLDDLEMIDILGAWIDYESQISHLLAGVKVVPLADLEPYYNEKPWTRVLKGRTVLVVHPFEDSIRSQYEKRARLFENPDVLPDFTIKTLKAVQSIAGTDVPFRDWFAAFEYMCGCISGTEFDVALIGAGSYGLPLAAHVKRTGRKSVHLGGALQLMFGIKGHRWDENPFVQQLYNEHWVRPKENEVPAGARSVEGGCYW